MSPSLVKFSPCVVIPYYNHGRRVLAVVQSVLQKNIACILVDDGSTDNESIEALGELSRDCILVKNPVNSGKGSALTQGFQTAASQGFTHVLTIDADGQHDSTDLENFLSLSKEFSQSIILGKPQFDESAPWERVWGRKLSTWFVWLQTRSFAVKDILCGFRVYPLRELLPILPSIQSLRMGFDIEVVVRFLWAGGTVKNIKTRVIYPKDGLSHFHYLRDNKALIRLHAGLFLKSFLPQRHAIDWFQKEERGSQLGLKLLLAIYSLLGKHVITILLHPISFFYLIFAHAARNASFQYHEHLKNKGVPVKNKWLHTYKTFFQFARSSLDALRAWKGDITPSDVSFTNSEISKKMMRQKQGAVVFTAHFGPIEASRALHRQRVGFKVYALMYLKHAMKFRGIIESISPGAHSDVLSVEKLTISSLTNLQEKIEEGGFLGIMADRLSPQSTDRFIEREFLGQTARFPEGPFLLAATLQVPVLAIVASYQAGLKEFAVEWHEFIVNPDLQREERIRSLVDQYVKLLEGICMKYPEQFFNFYDYWKK